MARRGRKRKHCARQPNGQPSRAAGHMIDPATPELVRHRAAAVGAVQARNALAGTAIGRLMLAGLISDAQHDAAQRFFADCHVWSLSIGAPPRHPPAMDPNRVRGRASAADTADVEQRVMSAWAAMTMPERVVVEAVVLDDYEPPTLRERATALDVLHCALDKLAMRYIGQKRKYA